MKLDDDPALRVPPHSLDAERSVLGGLMLDNGSWDRMGDTLHSNDFYRLEHQQIFSAIGALISANKPVDIITVHEELKRLNKAEECGGLGYLNELVQSVASAANIRTYARYVRDHAERRSLIAAAATAQEIAWSSDSTPTEQHDRIATLFATLERRGMAKEPHHVGDLVTQRLGHYEALAAGETVAGIPTGIASLDRALGGGFKRGSVVVLGARPSEGKSSLAAGQIARSIAAGGHPVLVLSQEMTGGELVDRLFANTGGVQMGSLTSGRFVEGDWARLAEAADGLSRLPLFIDDSPALTLGQIRVKARQQLRKHGLAVLVVDYLQLCSALTTTDRRHHQIEGISRGLKQLAKELNICVLLLSQLNRTSTERGEPELTDLKESGSIEEDADVVVLLHRMGPEPDGAALMLAKLAKNRQGRRGRLALSFDEKLQRWRESSGNVERRAK